MANHGSATSDASVRLLREEQIVWIGGVAERWQLRWRKTPVPSCDAAGPMWITCSCRGFAFGEAGQMDLIRIRERREMERFPLTPFFDGNSPNEGPEVIMQRWAVSPHDIDAVESAELPARVRRRPVAKAIQFDDYDHDGVASEFFLQTGTLPCGKRTGIVLGVSRRNPKLHAFGTVLNPGKPLTMQIHEWLALAKSAGPTRVMDWTCGDHGGNTEVEVELTAAPVGIDATYREYECTDPFTRGRLLKSDRR
jgi:hypothetical protein